jgi:hypothetical protein
MLKMELEQIIFELLLRHNCVVLPNFGGFISSQVESKIDFSKGLILPPNKVILFNKHLINNDGLIYHYFSTKNNISIQDAIAKIDQTLKIWFLKLQNAEKINIEKIGVLFIDAEQNLKFEQDRFYNLFLQSFGLNKVTFSPQINIQNEFIPEINVKSENKNEISLDFSSKNKIEQKISSEVKEITIKPKQKNKQNSETKIITPNFSKKVGKKIFKYAAVACLIPIAFYSVWIPTRTDVLESGVIFSSDFSLYHKIQKETYQKEKFNLKFDKFDNSVSFDNQVSKLPKNITVFSLEFSKDLYIPVKLKNETVLSTAKSNLKANITSNSNLENNKKNTTIPSKSFSIIVGSFSNLKNAENLINELKTKGFNSFLMNENELIRVCASTSNSSEETTNLLNKLNSLNYQAWVLKSKF